MIPEEIRNANPDIAWRDMAGMRDVLVHAYFRTDPVLLYQTGRNRIPQQLVLLKRLRDEGVRST